MSEANLSALFWEGFRVDYYEVKVSDQLHIQLVPDADVVPVCSGCDHDTHLVHDVYHRRVRERDFGHYRVWLDVPGAGTTPALPAVRPQAGTNPPTARPALAHGSGRGSSTIAS